MTEINITIEGQIYIACHPERIQSHQYSILTGDGHPESNHKEISGKSKTRNGLLGKRRTLFFVSVNVLRERERLRQCSIPALPKEG